MRRLRLAAALAALAAILVLSAVDLYARLIARPPTTLAEVEARAEAAGLRLLHTSISGVHERAVLVSVDPLRALPQLRVNDPAHPAWLGRLLVTDYGDSGIGCADPPSRAAWGRLHVFGDPRLIARIATTR
jgi:hypothetical protein